MAGRDPTSPVATPPQTSEEQRARSDETSMTREPDQGPDRGRKQARPDPRTGEVPAGPGDAGLESRPEVNKGTPGTKQMSNRRLGIGLGIAALLAVLAFILAAIF